MNSRLEEAAPPAADVFATRDPSPEWPAILMVDDHHARLLTYEAILAGMPVRFVRATSGEEALQLLLKRSFALILLDVNMPGIDGFEVARHVRGLSRLEKIPIIFVSGERLTDLDRLKGYEVGAIDYISVPIVPEILRSKVAVLVELFNRRCELERLNTSTVGVKVPPPADVASASASAGQLRALFEQTSDIAFILKGDRNADGTFSAWRYVDVNASALALYGLSRHEVVGRTVQEVFPDHSARATALCERALLGRERLQHETEFRNRQLLVRMFALDADSVAVNCTDITDRKRVEMALANSERRFQALLASCPVGVAQNGMDGRFEYVNAGFCEIVGYTADELSRLTWQQITHPDDLDPDLARAKRVLAGDLPHYTLEKRYLRKDGSPVWVSMFGNFIFDEQRRPIQGVAVIVDITARRLADQALEESRQRLLLAHDAAGLGSFDWNVQLDSATWDTRARELWGVSPEIPVNLGVALAGIHPDDRALVVAAVDRALAPDSEGRYRATYRVINVRDGKTRWVESHGQVLFENGRAKRMVGTKRDITERVEAEHRLRRGEERFRDLANNIDQIVWTVDAAGQPTWFNDRWYEFSGTNFQQMVDEGWSHLVHPDHRERILNRFRECMQTGEPWEETFPVRGKRGDYRWFLSRAIPIRNDDGKVARWFGSNTDITAHRRLQEALTDADRRKDEFLAMLAHELRNPVAPILSVARLLARQGNAVDDLPGLVSIIQRQASHLARLLDDLLDVARVTRGRIDLRREVVPLENCVALAVETVGPLIEAGEHPLTVEHADADLWVHVDKDRLTQCMTNVLKNAVDYSPRGSRIHLRTSASDGVALIEIEDRGRGIPAAVLPRIFDLFAQDDRTLDRRTGGLGIGLSVCKRLIEMHGGSITAHSEGEGRGATFRMSVPLAQKLAQGIAPVPAPRDASTKRVLIVDDNQDAAEAIGLLLQMDGHETKAVFHGRDALEAWHSFAPDIVILDIGLPDLSGYDVAARLREAGFKGVLIALSGYGQPDDKRRALESGFDVHLVKPVEPQTLEAAMSRRS